MKHHLLLLPSPLPLLLHRPSKPLLLHVRHRRCYSPDAASNDNSGDPSPATSEPSTDTQPAPSTKPPSNPKPTGVKNRLRARNQARRTQEVSTPPEEVKSKKSAAAAAAAARKRRKEWEEMSMGEKAGELYVGEKGLLFWLNKFAYASIFIMVGGWVLFRFVGPSLGLYQLDAPPLPPTAVFTGSP